jgi:hypothetical protein
VDKRDCCYPGSQGTHSNPGSCINIRFVDHSGYIIHFFWTHPSPERGGAQIAKRSSTAVFIYGLNRSSVVMSVNDVDNSPLTAEGGSMYPSDDIGSVVDHDGYGTSVSRPCAVLSKERVVSEEGLGCMLLACKCALRS